MIVRTVTLLIIMIVRTVTLLIIMIVRGCDIAYNNDS